MSDTRAKRLIVVGVLVASGLSALRDWTEGDAPSVSRLVAVLAAGVMLAVLAELAPQIAGPFAVLLLVAVLLNTAPEVYRNLANPGGTTL